jgi:ABC-2 type transport system permease protein
MLEWRLVAHSRLTTLAIVALFVLSTLSVWSGMRAMEAQHAALARVMAVHQEDLGAVKARYANDGDAGYFAYYAFHLTSDPPPPLSFLAWGQRDLLPAAVRVRLLGLHSQLYESETVNPELALPGKFDFAFVLVYLAPLFIIVLMHDWVTAERESGRLRLMTSLPVQPGRPWIMRAWLRYCLVLIPLMLPPLVGIALARSGWQAAGGVVLIAALYVGFWAALSMLIGARARSSVASATTALACFVCLTLLLPALANAAITRLVPAGKGVELAMAQRQEVHQGWDAPKAATFAKFFRSHPEWRDTTPVTGRFHWKWYYAMHQAGDEAVEPLVHAYAESLRMRERWTGLAGWLLPAAAAQVGLHRMADTDLHAQLAYQESIRQFHGRLRHYFYPYFFNERRFGEADFRQLPAYERRPSGGTPHAQALFALALALVLSLAAAAGAIRALGGNPERPAGRGCKRSARSPRFRQNLSSGRRRG